MLALACYGVPAAQPPDATQHDHDGPTSPAAIYEFSCGRNSLYVLLKLLGRPAPIEDINRNLEVGENGECSMAQFREAAAHFGIALAGRRLTTREFSKCDRPFVVLMEDRHDFHGHFLVSRWINGNRSLQAIDPPKKPLVIPAEKLLAFDGPPFPCLLPEKRASSIWRSTAAVLCGFMAVAALLAGFGYRVRLSRSPSSPLTEPKIDA